MSRLIAIMLLALLVGPAAAQPPGEDFPTAVALAQMPVPAKDSVQLARWFRGAPAVLPTPGAPTLAQVGDRAKFWVSDTLHVGDRLVGAQVVAVGEHIVLWLEDGAPVARVELEALAQAFDARIYHAVRELWGSEPNPGVDGDPRVHGLFAYGLGNTTAAYFMSRHLYPTAVHPSSNQREMFFFNLDAIGTSQIDTPTLESIVAHEFQHMIRANIQDNEVIWLNEGFSTFTQLLLFGDDSSASSYLGRPQTQLNWWPEEGSTGPSYGAALLFVTYFYERYGPEALRRLSADPLTGLASFDAVLAEMGEPGVDTLFADWLLANELRDATLAEGQYGYRLLPALAPRPPREAEVTAYPYTRTTASRQYASHTYTLKDLFGRRELVIDLTLPDSAPLLETDAYDGRWFWTSNTGDQSMSTLTRAFDLSGVTAATLEYRAWWDIEDFWDYAYVMVSADDGASWTILETEHTTAENPVDAAYGPGYTGESGGWRRERLALDGYAGQRILVRFALITDDAISRPGLAVDEVRLDAIGYASSFEDDGGGWEAAGWVRADNRLPQQAWLQVIQRTATGFAVTRALAPGETPWRVTLLPDAVEARLIVAPFAPFTTELAPYSLTVDVQ